MCFAGRHTEKVLDMKETSHLLYVIIAIASKFSVWLSSYFMRDVGSSMRASEILK